MGQKTRGHRISQDEARKSHRICPKDGRQSHDGFKRRSTRSNQQSG